MALGATTCSQPLVGRDKRCQSDYRKGEKHGCVIWFAVSRWTIGENTFSSSRKIFQTEKKILSFPFQSFRNSLEKISAINKFSGRNFQSVDLERSDLLLFLEQMQNISYRKEIDGGKRRFGQLTSAPLLKAVCMPVPALTFTSLRENNRSFYNCLADKIDCCVCFQNKGVSKSFW